MVRTVRWHARVRMGLSVAVAASLFMAFAPRGAEAGTALSLSADLDGKPIALVDVGKYQCHDLDYPRIHCFASAATRDAAAAPLLASSSATYVIAWNDASYSGASFVFSQDYTLLVTIGWNDRISSFKAQNSLSGRFWTDWFYSGAQDGFCCNQTVPYVGNAFNDTFSSVQQQ